MNKEEKEQQYCLNTHLCLVGSKDGTRPKTPDGMEPCSFEVFGTEKEIVNKLLSNLLLILARHISDENKTDMMEELSRLRKDYKLNEIQTTENP